MITDEIQQLLTQRLPEGWFVGAPEVTLDDDEVLIVGVLPEGTSTSSFRERTREERVAVASELERRLRRRVAWGVVAEGRTTVFTSLSLPVMTRLRLAERRVLDTLVDAGVARSRSDALAWCVKLVARHQQEWLDELRSALVGVERVRSEGPTLG